MRIAIVGGGAAGLMAAAAALETNPQAEIFVIERNTGLGKKVLISGGGRCNVTTGIQDVKTVLTKYPRGGKFLSSAMYQFPPEAVYTWFESHGVPLKTEEDLRVFPESDNGADIVGVFETLFRQTNTQILLGRQVQALQKDEQGFAISFKDSRPPLHVDKVILTTGGQAYRQTGSTGDGYAFAMSLGHTITPLAASLNAFFTKETWPHLLSGLSFEEATIRADRPQHAAYTGPFLFTHKGVSGPAVFALSSLVAFETYDATHPLLITLDLFPHRSSEDLLTNLLKTIAQQKRKSFLNILSYAVPKALATIVCEQCRVAPDAHAAEVSHKDARACMDWLKQIPLTVIARGAGDEFVTAGGIETKDVMPQTMESRLCPGLFFAGELLDIDGFTGGFNLQASWATGRLAGLSAASG